MLMEIVKIATGNIEYYKIAIFVIAVPTFCNSD